MTNNINIINNLSTLTTVPTKILTKLTEKEILCIGSAVSDAIKNEEDAVVLNIGFGTLSIELKTGLCKFLPSNELKNTIKKCINNKIDPLEENLEQAIIDKLLKIYEEGF